MAILSPRRRISSRWLFALIAMAISVLGVAFYIFSMPTLRPHAGDGVFLNTSWRFPGGDSGIPVPGYQIRFPDFDLSKDFIATYRISDLPEIKKDAMCYLCVEDSNHDWNDKTIRNLVARFEIDVVDEHGRAICHVDHFVRDLIWSTAMHARMDNAHGLYNLDESRFDSRSNSHYTLKIRYIGDPQFKAAKGYVYVECGGSI
jgi:sulfur relay (sulfurtransferase) DsrC/TusE family protein